MGDQLSFEDVLFDRERKLLFFTSHVDRLLQILHYHRTKVTSTILTTMSTRIGKQLSYAKHNINSALGMLAELDYYITLELGVTVRPKDWYTERMDSDRFVEDAATTPYALYEDYIRIYKVMQYLFEDNKELIEELSPCKVLVREIYVDMQEIGKLYEEIL